MLSSPAQLAESASANGVSSAPSELMAAAAYKMKEQHRRYSTTSRMLHKVVDEADVIIFVLNAREPAGCHSQLVEEEVHRREAEWQKCLVFVSSTKSVRKAQFFLLFV